MRKPIELDPDVAFLRLDMATLGDTLVRLVLTARQLGHRRPQGTASDYYYPQTAEMAFIHDAFNEETEVIIARWFGSDANAVQFTNTLLNLPT